MTSTVTSEYELFKTGFSTVEVARLLFRRILKKLRSLSYSLGVHRILYGKANITMADKWRRATGKVICNDFGQTGSGFFIDDKGFFVTNNHVVHKVSIDATGAIRLDYSNQIFVKTDGNTYRARLVIDENSDRPVVYDYAILKLEIDTSVYFDTTDNSGILQGDEVISIGYPLDFDEPVITKGVISAIVSRPSHINALHRLKTFLTDTLITYGSSGGPLVRASDGKVIGINTMPHEIKDVLRTRLQNYIGQNDIQGFPQFRDLVEFVLKYLDIGLNYAISVKYAMSDPAFRP